MTLRIGDGHGVQFLQCVVFDEHAAAVAGLKEHDLIYVEKTWLRVSMPRQSRRRHAGRATR